MTSPWIGNTAWMSVQSDQNCGFFINSKYLGQCNFSLLSLYIWTDIMSSPLVTFDFKTFPKHRSTQFSIVMAQIWEMLWRPMVSINYDKKSKRFDFFNFFSNKSYLFCLKLSSTLKMLSLEVFHVDIAQ